LLRLQTISRGAGYVDTLFYLLKALARSAPPPADAGDKSNAKANQKENLKRAEIASRALLLKSIHSAFLLTAEGHLPPDEYHVFQKTWTVQFVAGRSKLAEWMAGTPLTVHVYLLSLLTYDASTTPHVRSTGAQQFYEHCLAFSERNLWQVYPDEHQVSLHVGGR
jgi:hypothetical protein